MPALLRKATNLSLDPALVHEARGLGTNLSQAAEDGLRAALRQAQAEAWQRENAAALQSSNDWVAEHGLPLERFRPF